MKNTGIVRRIDELGRIVIPKEIRRTLRLSEGTQMEIFTDEHMLVLKKHSVVSQVIDYSNIFVSSLYDATSKSVIVCDTDKVLSVAGVSKKEYLHKLISPKLEKLIKERKSYILNTQENTTTYELIEDDKAVYTSQVIVPIIVNSDTVGAIIMLSIEEDSVFTTQDVKIIQTIANLYGNLLE